jgi:hypothetical protein
MGLSTGFLKRAFEEQKKSIWGEKSTAKKGIRGIEKGYSRNRTLGFQSEKQMVEAVF